MSPIGGSDRHISCSTKSVAPSLSHAMVGDGLMLLGNFPTFKNILYFIVAGYTVTSNGWFKEEKVIHFETKYLSPVQSNPNPPEKEICVSKAVHFKREFMFPIQLRIVNPISLRSPWFHEIHEVHVAAHKFSYGLTLQITSMDIFHLQCCWSPSPPCSSVSTWPPWSGPRKKLNHLQCFPKVTMMQIAQERDYNVGLDSNEWTREKQLSHIIS